MNRIIAIILLALTAGTVTAAVPADTLKFVYKLHGQTRRFQYVFTPSADGRITLNWGIERNLKWWSGSYTMTPQAVQSATSMSFLMPEDGNHITLPSGETYAMISRDAYTKLKHSGSFRYNMTDYTLTDRNSTTPLGRLMHVTDSVEGAEMWILDSEQCPIVWEMRNNPLEINWRAEYTGKSIATAVDLREEIRLTPEKSGGIYYAYPYTSDVAPEPPAGYSPVYISHYGRHGSRWIIKEWQYPEVMEVFTKALEADNLTSDGKSVMQRVDSIWRYSRGHSGELSPLGERQHKAIAHRLQTRYPSLLSDKSHVEALSSTEPRCIVSMAAFCERLKETAPYLSINRHATPGNMDFIAYSTPEAKSLGKDSSPWRERFYQWCDSVIDSDRLMSALFVDPSKVEKPKRLMVLLHNIAVGQQDIESGVELLDIFTPEELYQLWRHLNYNMYVRHAGAEESENAGPHSARSLLEHILTDADHALTADSHADATLRFGHDTNLIRLLTLMQIEGCYNTESRPDHYHEAWQDFRVSPMGANLQLIFFRNADGHVITLVRHNERPVHLPLPAVVGTSYFYDWNALSNFWNTKL